MSIMATYDHIVITDCLKFATYEKAVAKAFRELFAMEINDYF